LIFPGVIGGIRLSLGSYALGTLPVNQAGIRLLVPAVELSIAELPTASFGLLTAGGIVDLIVGSPILSRGGTLFAVNPVLVAASVVAAAFLVFVIAKVVGAHRRHEAIPVSVLPTTLLGRWSVGLAIAFILSEVLPRVLTGFEPPNPESDLVQAIVLTIVVVGISGAAFVTGLISVIRRKERSVLVFVGMAITLWWGLIGAVGYLLI
jgi:hypothetical protein